MNVTINLDLLHAMQTVLATAIPVIDGQPGFDREACLNDCRKMLEALSAIIRQHEPE